MNAGRDPVKRIPATETAGLKSLPARIHFELFIMRACVIISFIANLTMFISLLLSMSGKK